MSKKNGLTFEESMTQLDKIAAELENGKLTLDETVAKFEEGMELSKKCKESLENAEKKITILMKTDDGVSEEDFEA